MDNPKKYRVRDKRSMRVVLMCHCVINQSAKLEGIAGWPGVINEVLDIVSGSGCGILQIPCPEMIYEGIGRFDKSTEQYKCAGFRKVCSQITEDVIDQAENYLEWGYDIPCLIAIDGSPSCGYNLSQTAPEWRGLVAEQSWKKVRYQKKSGVLIEQIQAELNNRSLDIPIVGIPEVPELGSLDNALKTLKDLLGSN